MDAGASGEILRGKVSRSLRRILRGNISKSAKAEVPPQTPPSWPRGFSVGTGVPGSIALGIGEKGEKEN